MNLQGQLSPWRYLVPSVLGCAAALIATASVAAMSGQQASTVAFNGTAVPPNFRFSIGIPTWYESSGGVQVTTRRVHWLNIFAFAAAVYLVAMPLGRLITDAARPVRAGRIFAVVTLSIAALAVLAGAGFSRYYWGYWFTRPSVDWRLAEARSLEGITAIDNLDVTATVPGQAAWVPEFRVRDGVDWSDTSRLSGGRDPGDYYTLQGRVLNALEDRGHDLARAKLTGQRSEAEAAALYRLVARSGWLDGGSAGCAATLTGYAIDFTGPGDESGLLLLTLSSGQVSNDHFAYYELLFGPPATPGDETTRPLIAANRFYYDVAGIEGLEWYAFAIPVGLLGLILALPLTAALLVVIGTRRRNNAMRRGFSVLPIAPAAVEPDAGTSA